MDLILYLVDSLGGGSVRLGHRWTNLFLVVEVEGPHVEQRIEKHGGKLLVTVIRIQILLDTEGRVDYVTLVVEGNWLLIVENGGSLLLMVEKDSCAILV